MSARKLPMTMGEFTFCFRTTCLRDGSGIEFWLVDPPPREMMRQIDDETRGGESTARRNALEAAKRRFVSYWKRYGKDAKYKERGATIRV